MTSDHWREYVAESATLALFMLSASFFATLLEHYQSPLLHLVPDPFSRRMMMGAAMGLTLAAIVYSPIGARSGAHMNPSVTLAFMRLGRVSRADGVWYVTAQFGGGILGMLAARAALGRMLGEPAVHYVVTRPGPAGELAAALGELLISFLMMSVVLRVAAHPRTMKLTGVVAATLVMLNITFEAPLSGMSMNPARTLGPALLAGQFDGLWIYFLVPPLGMLLAAELFRLRARPAPCAKFNHSTAVRCIFCGYDPHRGNVHHDTQKHEGTETICTTT